MLLDCFDEERAQHARLTRKLARRKKEIARLKRHIGRGAEDLSGTSRLNLHEGLGPGSSAGQVAEGPRARGQGRGSSMGQGAMGPRARGLGLESSERHGVVGPGTSVGEMAVESRGSASLAQRKKREIGSRGERVRGNSSSEQLSPSVTPVGFIPFKYLKVTCLQM